MRERECVCERESVCVRERIVLATGYEPHFLAGAVQTDAVPLLVRSIRAEVFAVLQRTGCEPRVPPTGATNMKVPPPYDHRRALGICLL